MAVTQASLLEGVSRTFALTIPQLPGSLYPAVANGYLLCRIIDTIEDEPTLHPAEKNHFCLSFRKVIGGNLAPHHFSAELYPRLSSATLVAEQELIKHTPAVIETLFSFNNDQQAALKQCVNVMSKGMAEFQQRVSINGLPDIKALNHYCYYVAGIVGEMLTHLFCDYSPAIDAHHDELIDLSVSFGQGLQMTNILKDVWDDLERERCWLPRDIFNDAGFDLDNLSPGAYTKEFGHGLASLISIATQHLDNAMRYTLLIPKQETGIRNFCLWAIGMAMQTLRKINANRDYRSSQQVKISRRRVQATVACSRLTASHNLLLRGLFKISQTGLPSLVKSNQLTNEYRINLKKLKPDTPASDRPA
ncbi:MAG: phytoene/squalene synthase family protein [Gammaproteobacteria bacterium]